MAEEPKEPEKEPEVKEARSRPRFVFKSPVHATFNAYPVRVINISGSGVQIEHADTLKLHSSAKLIISLPRSVDTVTVRGQIVWSKLSRTPNQEGKYLYRSGVRFEGSGPAVMAAADRVITIYSGEEDRDSLERKKEMLREKEAKDSLRSKSASLDSTWRRMPSIQRRIDPDQALLVEQTLARLKKEPQEISRLAARARKALEKKGEGLSEPDEVLAVWEYLDRLMPVGLVAEVISAKGKR